MKILITNDDGIEARGLKALYEVACDFGEPIVVAPDRNRSAVSSGLTVDRDIGFKKVAENWFSVDGTPADCMHLATFHILEQLPDLVLSGINHGSNLGDDVIYSGTLAGALEARFIHKPSIAFSIESSEDYQFESAKTVVKSIIRLINQQKMMGTYNVNIPNRQLADIHGIEVTRLGHRKRSDAPIAVNVSKNGQLLKNRYKIAPPGDVLDAHQGTDFDAIRRGFVSITPIHVDMTNNQQLKKLKILEKHREFE